MRDITDVEAADTSISLRQSMLNALENTGTSVLGNGKSLFEQLKTMLSAKTKNPSLNPNNIDHYEKVRSILDVGEAMLTKGGTSETEIAMRKKSRDATSIFHSGAIAQPSENHICYTAVEQLNNIPLHYLPFANGLLDDMLSCSRIHNVAQLELILQVVSSKVRSA